MEGTENILLDRKSIFDFRPLLEVGDKEKMFELFIKSELGKNDLSDIVKSVIDKYGYNRNILKVVGGVFENASKMKSLSVVDLKQGPYIEVFNGVSVCSRDMDIVKVKDKFIINDACSYLISDSYIIRKNEDGYSYERTGMNVGYESSKSPIILDVDLNDDGTITCTGRICMFNIIGEKVYVGDDDNQMNFSSAALNSQNITFPISSISFEGEGQRLVCMHQFNRSAYESDESSIIKPFFINMNDLKGVNVYDIAEDPEKYLSFSLLDVYNMI